MIVDALLGIAMLTGNLLVSSAILYVLLRREVSFGKALQLHCVAVALNKMLFTGSGYAAMSWKLKKEGIPLHKVIFAFSAQEMLSVSFWLIAGFVYGAPLAARFPVFIAVAAFLLFLGAWYHKDKIRRFAGAFFEYAAAIRPHSLLLSLYVLLHIACFNAYYLFLFRIYHFFPAPLEVLRIVSVSFTVGYLSPLPSGLGIKEGSLVFLLMKEGLPLSRAVAVAVTDRIVVTGFYLLVGFACGAKMMVRGLRRERLPQDFS